jgi:cobalt/nickel transport system permease protein
MPPLTLIAVHISDGVLDWRWQVGGLVGAALLLAWAQRRTSEAEVARVGLLAAVAFVVSSLVHIPVPPTSVHLLLTGLLGVVLGRLAVVAVAVELGFQWALVGHGGLGSLGVNVCVQALPAVAAGAAFRACRASAWLGGRGPRLALVVAAVAAWLLAAAVSVELLLRTWGEERSSLLAVNLANLVAFRPLSIATILVIAATMAVLERGSARAPNFPLGLALGGTAAFGACALNFLVLLFGGTEDWTTLALTVLVAHLPVVAVEGLILGFAVAFLARVRPDLLGDSPPTTTAT